MSQRAAPRSGRRSGSPDTRGVILAAARHLFAEDGFERTTIRAVAARADVDPALVHHYFGTKAGLFAAVGQLPYDPAEILAGLADDPDRAGYEIARRVLGMFETNDRARTTVTAMIRATASRDASADAIRGLFEQSVHVQLRRIVSDDTAELRASLVASQMAGIVLGRHVMGFPGLRDVSADALVVAVAPVLQHYITGDISAPTGATRGTSAPFGPTGDAFAPTGPTGEVSSAVVEDG